MEPDFRFQEIARHTLHRLVHAPIAALAENRHAVDRNGKHICAGHIVSDFADAKVQVVRVGNRARLLKAQPQRIKIRLAETVRPPEARVEHVQFGRVQSSVGKGQRAFRPQSHWHLKTDIAEGRVQDAALRNIGDILQRGAQGQVGRISARQREVGSDKRVLDDHRAGSRERDFLPDANVPVADRRNPVPTDRANKSGAVLRQGPAIAAEAEPHGLVIRITGMQRGQNLDGHRGGFAGRDELGHVEDAPREGALDRADTGAVHEHFRHVVNSLKVQPDLPARVTRRHGELHPIPIGRAREAFGNVVQHVGLAVVQAVKRFGIDAVIDEAGQNGSRHGGLEPFAGLIGRLRNAFTGLSYFRRILQQPTGRQGDGGGNRCVGGLCG